MKMPLLIDMVTSRIHQLSAEGMNDLLIASEFAKRGV